MKKYILVITLIALALITALFISVSKIEKENTKLFSEAGYILQSNTGQQVQEVERFYFNANENYKKQYNEKIQFKDTNGGSVVVSKDNFLHFTNGSIGSLTKGVILNLDRLEDDPIMYYTLKENQILKKNGDIYTIKNLKEEISFKNFICKISDEKYLICGVPIQIHFQNGEIKEFTGYLEIEYADNQVVKLYNQEITYQTVSSNLFITLPNEVKINLANKIVSKNNQNVMSLENMTINSEDNIEIVDLEEEKFKPTEENKTDENAVSLEEIQTNTTNNNTTNSNPNNQQVNTISQNNRIPNAENNSQIENNKGVENTENSNTQSNGGQQIQNIPIQIDNGGAIQATEEAISVPEDTQTDSEQEETILEEVPEIIIPSFKVEEFDVDSISMTAKITITDNQSLLVDNPVVTIIRNDTGKIVYQNEETSGAFDINLTVSSLLPDIEYTLITKATYKVEEDEYSKNFVYKIFRTKSSGIELQKDYFTDSILAFKCNIEEDSKVSGADIVLMNEQQEIIETKKVERESLEGIEFQGLNSNSNYIVTITNVIYNEQVITNGFEKSKTYKTLKQQAELGKPIFEIDKRNGQFLISIQEVLDIDGGITNCKYEIYDARTNIEESEPVLTINSDKNEQKIIPVDEVKIQREIPYIFKFVVDFNDNEKEIEIESGYSDIMIMNGKAFPTLRFEERLITHERILGTIIVEDNNTIELSKETPFTIIYTDSIGNSKSYTSAESLNIPVELYGLRKEETYKFSVYAKVDLRDGNDPIDKCYIGGVVVKTKSPQNMQANFVADEEDVRNTFLVDFNLQMAPRTQGEIEATTLAGMTFNIYAGQTTEGTPFRTVTVKGDVEIRDNYTKEEERYISTLKTDYFDKSVEITPAFFGAENKDFRDKCYTITVSSAYDYTEHQNELPIVQNQFVLETKGYRPDLPVDVDNAIDVSVIRNKNKDSRSELDPSTIVGYEVKAKYNNSDLYARTIKYSAYNSNTKELIKTIDLEIGQDGVIPSATFDVFDGTDISELDTNELKRGNMYYFTYEIMIDLNGDGIGETKYPYEEENVVLKSSKVVPKKQEAKIQMFPSVSTSNSITYKYKVFDIDHTIIDNKMMAYIGIIVKNEKILTISEFGDESYNEVVFENLTSGEFSLIINEALTKYENSENKVISEYYFEGKTNLDTLRYNVEVSLNRVVITLYNDDKKMQRIGAVDVIFKGESKTIIKEMQTIDSNMIIINLSDIAELKDENIEVEVEAYYDTGLVGFNLENEYSIFEKAYKTGEEKYYCSLNKYNNWVYSPTAMQNMYISELNEYQVNLVNTITNQNSTINLIQLPGGLSYEYDLINQKQVEKEKIKTDGSNIINFDLIIPEISLQDSEGRIDIVSDLRETKINAKIINPASTEIKNQKIYIDLYKTDENGNNEEFVKTYEKLVSDFNQSIILSDLQPKTYYYIRFKANLLTTSGAREEYLYDKDYQVLGKYYYFSTLATVGINNIRVEYSPIKYTEKSLDIHYTLDRIFGFDKISYTLQKYNQTSMEYETIIDNLQDTKEYFNREMKKKVECNPGSVFSFGEKYKVIITPIAISENQDGTIKEVEVGAQEAEFELQNLQNPLFGITGKRRQNNRIQFTFAVYDNDRIVKDDEYQIKILNERDEDITPEEYKNKKFKTTSLLNNKVIISDVNRLQKYTIEIFADVDIKNNGRDITTISRRYTVRPANESGIDVGNITATANFEQVNKIDLIFNETYNLTEIDEMKYSIYDINGYSKSGTQKFIVNSIPIGDETVYSITLDENLVETAKYFIELQFYKKGTLVNTYSLNYTYIE